MDVNNFKILQNGSTNNSIVIPIELNWDLTGQDQSIELYQSEIEGKVVGKGYDFEVTRFPHEQDLENSGSTQINYQFYFHSGSSLSTQTNWTANYLSQNLSTRELYYNSTYFTKSFFKLDLYDTVDNKRQTNYLSIIIPTQEGLTKQVLFNNRPVDINIPFFELDYVGNREGFFIYWLKTLDFLNINTFYMTAKFYNAKTGQFIKMTNKPQSTISGDKYNLDSMTYFYYRVVLDYVSGTYKIFDITNNNRIGVMANPIKWYEYVNPPQ